MESTSTIDWKSRLGEVEGEEIPFDITFNVFEEGTLMGGIQAHKMVLAIASPVFKRQFFTCDTQDKSAADKLLSRIIYLILLSYRFPH